MAEKYRDTDYVYGSARVRAMENRLAGQDALNRMVEARSVAEIVAMLPDFGFELIYADTPAGKKLLREQTLCSVLHEGYREVAGMVGEVKTIDFLRYPYDCNNIKTVIKCESRGISPEGMLLDFGTVPAEKVSILLREKDYGAFPMYMGKAIPVAVEAFAESGNPQKIDLILDRACFADMRHTAEQTNIAYVENLVKSKIDMTNLLICLRLCRMELRAAGLPLLKEALIEGGYLSESLFLTAYEGGEEKFCELLGYTQYSSLAELAGSKESFNIIEKKADDLWLAEAGKAKYLPFGAEVAVAYLISLEYEVKNIRMILAGKEAGLSREVIRERLRSTV